MREFFDQVAERGGVAAGVGYRSEGVWLSVQRALALLTEDLAPTRLLDVGCGHGSLSAPMAKRHDLLGLDYSVKMCARARANGIEAVAGDALTLPFPDGAFGAAIAIEVLQLIEDAPALLREMARVVAPGGSVIVGTAARGSVARRLSHVAIRMRLLDRGTPDDIPLPILRSARQLVEDADGAGLQVVQTGAVYFPLPMVRVYGTAAAADGPLASNILVRFTRT